MSSKEIICEAERLMAAGLWLSARYKFEKASKMTRSVRRIMLIEQRAWYCYRMAMRGYAVRGYV